MAVTNKFRLSLPVYNETGWDDNVNANFTIIDAVLGQYIALSDIVGVWTNSTAYNVGEKVIDSADSSVWECLIAHTSAASGLMSAARTANPTYWESGTSSLLEAAASAAAAAVSATQAQAAAASIAGLGAYRNAVINGGMNIWQRGSPLVPVVGATYLADRWRTFFNGAGGTTTVTRRSNYVSNTLLNNAGLTDYLEYNVTVNPAGQTTRQLAQDIEGVETFSGRQCVLSFYGRVNSGTQVINAFVSQNFGTGGSPSANVDQTVGLPQLTTTWQRFSYAFTFGSITGKTLGSNGNDLVSVVFFLPAGAVAQYEFTGVQLEIGSVATPFAYRPIQQEMDICKRYCQTVEYVMYGYQTIGNIVLTAVNHPVAMRTTPTATIIGAAANVNVTAPAVATSSTQSNYGGTATATGPFALSSSYLHVAELQ